jgi:AcrR family transcriptional regulator
MVMSTDVTEQKMRADARRSRARLIEAATAAFAENGADAPLDDIARRAGVGIGTLYRHFPTRIDLQAAVFRSQVTSVCSQADAIMVSSAPEQAFAAWLRVLARYLVTKRGLSRAVMDSLGKDSELVSSCYLAMRETVDRLLASGQQAGVLRTDLTSTDVLRLVHGVAITTERAPEETDRLLSLLLDGMRPQLFPIGPRPRGPLASLRGPAARPIARSFARWRSLRLAAWGVR